MWGTFTYVELHPISPHSPHPETWAPSLKFTTKTFWGALILKSTMISKCEQKNKVDMTLEIYTSFEFPRETVKNVQSFCCRNSGEADFSSFLHIKILLLGFLSHAASRRENLCDSFQKWLSDWENVCVPFECWCQNLFISHFQAPGGRIPRWQSRGRSG